MSYLTCGLKPLWTSVSSKSNTSVFFPTLSALCGPNNTLPLFLIGDPPTCYAPPRLLCYDCLVTWVMKEPKVKVLQESLGGGLPWLVVIFNMIVKIFVA